MATKKDIDAFKEFMDAMSSETGIGIQSKAIPGGFEFSTKGKVPFQITLQTDLSARKIERNVGEYFRIDRNNQPSWPDAFKNWHRSRHSVAPPKERPPAEPIAAPATLHPPAREPVRLNGGTGVEITHRSTTSGRANGPLPSMMSALPGPGSQSQVPADPIDFREVAKKARIAFLNLPEVERDAFLAATYPGLGTPSSDPLMATRAHNKIVESAGTYGHRPPAEHIFAGLEVFVRAEPEEQSHKNVIGKYMIAAMKRAGAKPGG